jgi:uncharacterized repeat protein (TIGR03803 family)
VFSITPGGSEKVLHSFNGPPDGAFPAAALLNVKGTLYGTTAEGGRSGGCRIGRPKIGCGTVYSIRPSGSEKVLYRFNGATGSFPAAPLIDVAGTLYGTTEYGGGTHGQGTVYSVTPSGHMKQLYYFTFRYSGGDSPAAALINVNGILYGTTRSGGVGQGMGVVFRITTDGREKVLYAFGGSDGSQPTASLINVNGTLYGTTLDGGKGGCNQSQGCGTVFSLTTGGTEEVQHSFAGGSDGWYPWANLINVNGTFYGTTMYGGSASGGTVYAITP